MGGRTVPTRAHLSPPGLHSAGGSSEAQQSSTIHLAGSPELESPKKGFAGGAGQPLSQQLADSVTWWSRDPQAGEPEAAPSSKGSSTQKCFLVAGQDPKKENLSCSRRRFWDWSVERGCVTQRV